MPLPVYLVRHGQSTWNVLRLTQGQTSHPPLTVDGRHQAARAAELIARDVAASGRRVDRILTSDLVRAVQTADVLAERLGATVTLEPRLREQHLGALQGRGYVETWAHAEQHDWSDPSLPIAGGEAVLDVHARMVGVLADREAAGLTVLVSHGDAIRAAIALTATPPHLAPWVDVANGSVACFTDELTWL